MARRRGHPPPPGPVAPVDLGARWRDLCHFGMATEDRSDRPHHVLWRRLEASSMPLAAKVATVEAFLAERGGLEGFNRFHARGVAFRQTLNNNKKGTH